MGNILCNTGLTYDAARRLWLAQIRIDGVKVNLGRFARKSNAQRAYRAARARRDDATAGYTDDTVGYIGALHTYLGLALDYQVRRDGWRERAHRWLDASLDECGAGTKELVRAAIRAMRFEANPLSADYQAKLERTTESALNAVFEAAALRPVFADSRSPHA